MSYDFYPNHHFQYKYAHPSQCSNLICILILIIFLSSNRICVSFVCKFVFASKFNNHFVLVFDNTNVNSRACLFTHVSFFLLKTISLEYVTSESNQSANDIEIEMEMVNDEYVRMTLSQYTGQ